MKNYLKKMIAFGLALALLGGQAALASEALGWDLHQGTWALGEGTSVTRGYFWSDTYRDLRTERYFTYTPNTTVVPTVYYGDRLYQCKTLTAMAQALEAQGKRVVGGTNGDFYVMATGQPLGMVVTDGVLRSSSSYHYAVGFRADGTAFIGQPQLDVIAWLGDVPVRVTGGVNKTRELTVDGGGLLLLTPDFGTSTGNYYPGIDVVLRPVPADEAPTVSAQPRPALTPTPADVPAESAPALEGSSEAVSDSAEPVSPGDPAPAESDVPFVEIDRPVETGVPESKAALPYTDDLRIGGRVRCVVESVTETSGGAAAIPEGCFVLTINGSDVPDTVARLRELWPGALVDIDVTSEDERWNEAVTALGGMFRFIENGEVYQPLDNNWDIWNNRTSRTAIGIKADGTVIFYAIDGPLAKNSAGANCSQVAKRLKELGCVDAIGLDGGGSTTVGITPMGEETFGVINSPRYGVQRAVTNAIFLTTTAPATGVPGSLQIEPGDALLLSGAALPLTAYQVDTAYRRMDVAADVTYTLKGDGSVTDGVYTAAFTTPNQPVGCAVTTVTAHQGDLTGTATLTTVATPDAITLNNAATGKAVTALSLSPGETVQLTASSVWRNLPLLSQNENYLWSCDPKVGTVDEHGLFTAGKEKAAGSLTVTAGERTLTVPVAVAGHITLGEDMEDFPVAIMGTPTAYTSFESDLTRVKRGRQSLRVDYSVEELGYARLNADLAIPAGERYVGLWVYGDGSGNQLWADFQTPDGVVEITAGALDGAGWSHRFIPIPQGATALTGLRVTPPTPGEETTGSALWGSFWLDHLTLSNGEVEDVAAPMVTVTVEGTTLTARVTDDMVGGFDQSQVSAQYDGKLLEGSWNAAEGILTAAIPEDPEGYPHRVTVTARDQSGNLGRGTALLPGTAADPFMDMAGHWASPSVLYLYGQGVTQGFAAEGGAIYEPQRNITRAEFSTMVAKWLRLDLTAYEAVEVPFADLGETPDWALPAVKALYACGIVTGSQDGDALYGRSQSEITRVEVMTILGRTQEKGWTEADLDRFTDGAMVPDWAVDYVKSLVGQDVIHGYDDGSLRPTAPMTRAEAAAVLCNLR